MHCMKCGMIPYCIIYLKKKKNLNQLESSNAKQNPNDINCVLTPQWKKYYSNPNLPLFMSRTLGVRRTAAISSYKQTRGDLLQRTEMTYLIICRERASWMQNQQRVMASTISTLPSYSCLHLRPGKYEEPPPTNDTKLLI